MRIEDWSRKRWVAFSLVLGLGLSFARVQLGQPSPTQTSTIGKLEPKLLREPVTDADQRQYPWAADVRLYPSLPVPSETGQGPRRLAVVTFRLLEVQGNEFIYRPGAIRLEEPVQAVSPSLQAEGLTSRAYLDAISQATGRQVYEYVWWLEPRWIYPLWTGASLLLVGLAWPIVLDRLIRAGYGKRSDVVPPSLWQRWQDSRRERALQAAREAASAAAAAADPMLQKKTAAANQGLSADELSRLEAMEAGLRDFVAGGTPSPQDSGSPIAQEPVRELHAGPLQSQTEAPQENDPKAYGGEFYPTVAHGKRKSGENENQEK